MNFEGSFARAVGGGRGDHPDRLASDCRDAVAAAHTGDPEPAVSLCLNGRADASVRAAAAHAWTVGQHRVCAKADTGLIRVGLDRRDEAGLILATGRHYNLAQSEHGIARLRRRLPHTDAAEVSDIIAGEWRSFACISAGGLLRGAGPGFLKTRLGPRAWGRWRHEVAAACNLDTRRQRATEVLLFTMSSLVLEPLLWADGTLEDIEERLAAFAPDARRRLDRA